jgi:hypothetical protein
VNRVHVNPNSLSQDRLRHSQTPSPSAHRMKPSHREVNHGHS